MRGLGRWLREEPNRLPMSLATLSTGGLTSIALGAVFGPESRGNGFSASAFLVLLVLAAAYVLGGYR